jgi:hypothetical protein
MFYHKELIRMKIQIPPLPLIVRAGVGCNNNQGSIVKTSFPKVASFFSKSATIFSKSASF